MIKTNIMGIKVLLLVIFVNFFCTFALQKFFYKKLITL